jgi:SSS family solute:Na+ symporter
MDGSILTWPDALIIIISFLALLILGPYFAKKTKTSQGYFLADGQMPGWLVGFSMMATVVSSMTFLATPGFTFESDWRYMPTHFTLLIAMVLALYVFMPFFRRGHVNSAYHYLEIRFGFWARAYAAAGYILFQIARAGIVIYAVSLPFEIMTGLPVPWFVLIICCIVGFYSISGGLKAILWADTIQGILLIVGGLLCLPIIISLLPGGFSEILSVARADAKMDMGTMSFTFYERGFWVMVLNHVFWYSHLMCADQQTVQRYMSTSTEKKAKKSIILSVALTIPVWVYFTFLGTALFVFYKVFPNESVQQMASEQVLPFFILTQLPVGIRGLVIAGLGAAAMSTLSSMVNATAQTMTNDFYRRLINKNSEERHYLYAGRWFTFVFIIISLIVALIIHWIRTDALVNIQQMFITILSGGLLGLFMLGFLTKRVDNKSAFIATAITVFSVCFWLFAKSSIGMALMPSVAKILPDDFSINVLSNIFIFGFGYFLSVLTRHKNRKKNE